MPRILVVDDQPDSLLAARAALVGAGHDCVLAADGERALELLAAGGVDVVVIDPAMPLHDGWPVLAAAGSTPVVAVTGAGAGLGDGRVAARLPKPVSPARLVAAVADVLRP
ncbi:MAG TPA: response regulator [Acidimicrobiia bacterium]|nr:response regulator [Acidimicrobiia bacterium]